MSINVRHKINVPKNKLSAFTENYKEWDYTDDTEMTIGVIKALLSNKEFTTELLITKWEEEYKKGENEKGYGRNGHGSMSWYYAGEKSIAEIRDFQRHRKNPGNAPAMRSVPIGLIDEDVINEYARINAMATHPNVNAIISSQCIARATEYLLIKNGAKEDIIKYCIEKIDMNEEYLSYLMNIDRLGAYTDLKEEEFSILCGAQPIREPYFLAGINGLPSDSKYTTGSVLYILKKSKDAMDALRKSINLGGDVDSVASLTTGIMAGLTGLDSIPAFMIKNVEGVEYLEKIATEFEEKGNIAPTKN